MTLSNFADVAPLERSKRQQGVVLRSAPRMFLPRFFTLVLLLTSSACAGHSAKTLQARGALDGGKPEDARALLNKELKVKGASEVPLKEKKATPLLVLDRSMISQCLLDYKSSSSDLQYADKKVEMLDMSRTAVDDVGKYLFSDDTGPYKAPPYEKVMINTVNMQNYLARHDLNGARIEARRLAVMQKYLKDTNNSASVLNATGSYLAGFVFERSGRGDEALKYYDEALEYVNFQSLAEPIRRLSATSAYSTPRLTAYLKQLEAVAPAKTAQATPPTAAPPTATPVTPAPDDATASSDANSSEPGEVLILLNYGRIPAKEARRVPIGLALTYASFFMSAQSTATTNRLAAQGLVTWINFPDLEKPKRHLQVPQVQIDGAAITLEGAAALDLEARKVHEADKGKVMAAAITRLIARVVAGEAAGAAAKAASKDSTVGAITSILTQATLTAADTPDTRSWSTLPARMAVARLMLPPGNHNLNMKVQGQTRTETFSLDPGGWHAVVMTVLR